MNNFTLALEYFFIDLIGGIVRWPLWWYSKGLILILKKSSEWVRGYGKSLSLGVWIKNLFVPMFGMNDWQSRIISFFMRIAQIIFRGIAFIFLIFFVMIFVAVYIISLPVSVIAFLYYLTGNLWL